MFCSSDAESLAAETRRPPTLVMDFATNTGGGELHSIPTGFHVYTNGNSAVNSVSGSPLEENCVNPKNPSPNPRNPSPNPQNPMLADADVNYMECQRNHAANIGGHAVDGCGEFMADEKDFLKCAACGCHRNFHRRETKGEESPPPCEFCATRRKRRIGGGSPGSPLVPYYTTPITHGSTAATHMLGDSDDPDNNNSSYGHRGGMRKRFRTKFSQEQKDKMYLFAEKVGWKMQKQDEALVQQFCTEIGVEKGVLKVWMHNNKHTLGKKP